MEAQLGGEGAGFIPEETMRVGGMENRGLLLSDSQDQMVRKDWNSYMWQRAEEGQPPS